MTGGYRLMLVKQALLKQWLLPLELKRAVTLRPKAEVWILFSEQKQARTEYEAMCLRSPSH